MVTTTLQHMNVSMGAQNSYLVTVPTKMELISTSLNQLQVARVPSRLQITIVIDSSPVWCAPDKHFFVLFHQTRSNNSSTKSLRLDLFAAYMYYYTMFFN
mgnify:CR=1 FL=1